MDDVAVEWFELCDSEKSGQLYQATTLRAQVVVCLLSRHYHHCNSDGAHVCDLTHKITCQMRLERAAKVQTDETSAKLSDVKPGSTLSCDAFVQTMNQMATSTGKEAEVQAELLAMIDEVKRLGPPPAETGPLQFNPILVRMHMHTFRWIIRRQCSHAHGAVMRWYGTRTFTFEHLRARLVITKNIARARCL